MQGIEKGAKRDTELLLKKAERKRQLQCDVAILGGGPHGVASAMMLREIFPSFRILLVDENGLGGQWGSYGPNPSYWMNSRIRKANRNLPPIPRTAGNINPLGRYATMELSDVVRGYYALNTEMADVTRINGYLSVDGVLAGLNCQAIVNAGTRATMIVSTPNGDIYDIGARVIINACGRDQKSTLDPSSQEKSSPYYFDTRGVYRHYGNYGRKPNHQPLQLFHQKDITVVGGGDSALTAIEDTLGKLPPQSYGAYGPGRYRPNTITWIGAPGLFAGDIDSCLRSRYKDSIVQALPKDALDQEAVIRPIPMRAKGFRLTGAGVELVLDNGDVMSGDMLFDCTNQERLIYGPRVIDVREDPSTSSAVIKVGPGAKPRLPEKIQEVVERLRIPENTVSLWALMELTDQAARAAGKLALSNAGYSGSN
jgi:hypothetical protein